jgi:hypothetical protein
VLNFGYNLLLQKVPQLALDKKVNSKSPTPPHHPLSIRLWCFALVSPKHSGRTWRGKKSIFPEAPAKD